MKNNLNIDISSHNKKLCLKTIEGLKNTKYSNFLKNKKINLIENRKFGKYIKFLFNEELIYICFSEEVNKSRNTFLLQGFIKSYKDFMKESNKKKIIQLFLLKYVTNKFNNYVLNMLKTLNIEAINSKEYTNFTNNKIEKYLNINEINKIKNLSKRKNNFPTKIVNFDENNKNCIIYAKLDGTNINDVELLILVLSKWNYFINIFQIYKKKEKIYQKKIPFNYENINYNEQNKIQLNYDNFIYYENNKINNQNKINRQQNHLIFNLLSLHGYKSCYICKCDVEPTLEASHIYEFNKINKNIKLTIREKMKANIDPYNAFFLCKNHHKLFDSNLIIIKNKKFILNCNMKTENNKWLNSNFAETPIDDYDKYSRYIDLRYSE